MLRTKPLVAYYFLTYKCNDTCEFCKIWQDADLQKTEDPSTDAIKTNLSELKELGSAYLDLTGGEPLLRDDLPEILSFAKEKGFLTTLTTNCILYPEKAKEITEHIDRLVFSLDSPVPEEHDRIRGTACFDSFLESVKVAKSLGKLPIVNFTATRDSVRFLPEMSDFLSELKIPLWINPVYDYEGLEGFEPETIEHIKYYSRNKYMSFNLAALEFIKAHGNKISNPRCRASETTITISPDNCLLLPCSKTGSGKIRIEGSIRETLKKNDHILQQQGRMNICNSCTAWPYMLPSFLKKKDKYFFLNLWSLSKMFWKEYNLKKGAKQ